MATINILIAETQYLIIEGLQSIFARHKDIRVLGVMVNKQDLFDNLHELRPDLVVLDPLSLEGFRLDDLHTIETVCPGTSVLLITDISDPGLVRQLVETGAKGYLTKTCDEKEIIDAIYALVRGESMFCHKVVNILTEGIASTAVDCEPAGLSEREVEIIRLIANGYTTRQIADKLYRSFHTITTHRKNIMKKLGINSTSELMVYAMNTGLIQPREQLAAGK